ncbi:MAG: hypothetical protein RLZZ169_1030 [Pseudomonadota bacterium]|jgi:hypothetical protein
MPVPDPRSDLRPTAVDAALKGLGAFTGAIEITAPPLLAIDFPLAASYAASFPQHAFTVENAPRKEVFLLSPTCCYPVFERLAGSIQRDGAIYTNKAHCFRSEAHYVEGKRQRMFLMREYIYFSSSLAAVRAWSESVRREVSALIRSWDLEVEIVRATDPFFNPADFKMRFQQEQELKQEFLIEDLAVASVNLHMASFCKACRITAEGGGSLYSACFGLGFDRLIAMLKSAHE